MLFPSYVGPDFPSNDLAWDGESKRIIAVGDGREKYGVVSLTSTSAERATDSDTFSSSTRDPQPERSLAMPKQSMPYLSDTKDPFVPQLVAMMDRLYSTKVRNALGVESSPR